jgi:hypothetical protein
MGHKSGLVPEEISKLEPDDVSLLSPPVLLPVFSVVPVIH